MSTEENPVQAAEAPEASAEPETTQAQEQLPSQRPLRIYTRPQILRLYSSPLVSPPQAMPELREWFGAENEQNLNKKDNEPSTPTSARDRRFRRDADDGDTSSRPSFRSAVTQSSQMGSFKLRGADRDGDKDRDKEGQERLRNLSEKYDRDRLALSAPGARSKDRDAAPHMNSGSSRLSGPQMSTVASRRAETRETGKRKNGEGDDWRRGAENRRSGREDRADRARSRSRARDSSRPRRDRDKDRDRDRKDKDDDVRHERDGDEAEDPRHWRDDGKRDERMAARRERERAAREKEKDGSDRWNVVDDRESKSKRGGGRDKKANTTSEEGWERDRNDKEKEPAWMETYIPPSSSAGILGGQAPDGELDGIQVWKKGLKEKEQQAKDASKEESGRPSELTDAPTEPLDEIQQFKLMMKKEQERLAAMSSTSEITSVQQEPSVPTSRDAPTQTTQPAVESTQSLLNPTQSLLSILTSGEPPKSALSAESFGKPATSRLFPNPLTHDTGNADIPFNPPQGSRLLALGNRPPVKPIQSGLPGSSITQSNGLPQGHSVMPDSTLTTAIPPKADTFGTGKDGLRPPSAFSPFEEQTRSGFGTEDQTILPRRPDSVGRPDPSASDLVGYAGSKGSRFAKFFDGKAKEIPAIAKPQNPVTLQPNSGLPRTDATTSDHRTMDDLFAMLNNSAQSQQVLPASHQSQNQLHLLQQTQQHHPQVTSNHRLEPLYESRLDRNFVPDGMVPGLRTIPPARARDPAGIFNEVLDDTIPYGGQRVLQAPQRGLDAPYPNLGPGVYTQRNAQLAPQYRGGPSPAQNTHLQRLPPGLANLGGRPPHEPSHYGGLHGTPLHSSLHNGLLQPQQTQFNHNVGFVSQNQMRIPTGQVHQSSTGGLAVSNNVDLRSSNQLLGIGGPNRAGFSQVPNLSGIQNPLVGLRQQQQQQQLVMPQMLPQQLQAPPPQTSNSNAHDLIALLMGGPPRE